MPFRYTKSRVMFSANAPSWSTCMDKCLMYSQARAPSYSTQEELGDLIRWALATTVDKVALATGTLTYYPAFPSWFFWVAYRLKSICANISHLNSLNLVILRWREIGEITIPMTKLS